MAELNDLLVLNAEIAALIRAGIPLELGLRRFACSVSGRLGSLAERLAVRLESGQPLISAVREEEGLMSPLYAAVMEASMQANRLPEALEGLVRFGRALQDTRRQIGLALLYPTVVAVVAYGLFSFFAIVVGAPLLAFWDELSPFRSWCLPIAEQLRDTAAWWGPAVPLVSLGCFYVASWWARRWNDLSFLSGEPGGRGLLAGAWIPGVPQLYLDLDRAQTTHMLGLLLRHQVPLPEALRLVSQMSGSRQLRAAYQRLAAGVGMGRSLVAEVHFEPRLPLLIAQLLRAGAADSDLPDALEMASQIYYRRVERRAAWMRSTLSPAFAVIIGGSVTVLFALVLGLPLRWFYLELLQQL